MSGESESSHPKRRRRRKSLLMRVREEQVIDALLSHPTITAAAKACGVGESTVRRWLTRSAFRRRLARAREAEFAHTTNVLQGLSGEALQAIRRAMTCGNPAVELKAGTAWLDHALRWETARIERDEIAELKRHVAELTAKVGTGT